MDPFVESNEHAPETRVSSRSLEMVETCFARLYRSASEVYKVRRSLQLWQGKVLVDLSTCARRGAACREEHRMDERLAPGVALGVVAVHADANGELVFGAGDGEPTDWALRMRRLPDAQRADHRLAAGTFGDPELSAIAARLAAFHEQARGETDPTSNEPLGRLSEQIELRTKAQQDALDAQDAPFAAEIERAESWQRDFLDAQADRFLRRAKSEAIREGHGELALEHIFFDDTGAVQILAGLEMGPELRYADVAADISLLATDLAARHRVDLAERFVAEYARLSNDFDLYPLLDFYSSLRATQRAKLDLYCADRCRSVPAQSRAYAERARRNLALALSNGRRPLLPAAVVAMGGQVASGKSTLARHIARRIGAPVVSSDATRDFLLGARLNEELHEVNWEDAYENGFGERVYDEVFRRAGEVLLSGRPVVIDGCFRSRAQRELAKSLATKFGRPFLFVEATIDEGVQLERLAKRSLRDGEPLSTWKNIADQLRVQWEPALELALEEHLQLDTSRSLDQNSNAIEARLPTWPEALTG